ncbi:hypothetical protein BC832DRAFT_547252 [Gaertneriomyces semiglobifer]|nr:hypothetical protein BC832DRAFT_547252 [Gaertneriomyces semiglobifer]
MSKEILPRCERHCQLFALWTHRSQNRCAWTCTHSPCQTGCTHTCGLGCFRCSCTCVVLPCLLIEFNECLIR